MRTILAAGNKGHGDGTVGGKSSKGRDERGEFAFRHQQPVDHPGYDSSNKDDRERAGYGQSFSGLPIQQSVHQKDAHAAQERDERSDRKIDTAKRNHQCHAHGDDADERHLPKNVQKILRPDQDAFSLCREFIDDRKCNERRKGGGGHPPDRPVFNSFHAVVVSNPAA